MNSTIQWFTYESFGWISPCRFSLHLYTGMKGRQGVLHDFLGLVARGAVLELGKLRQSQEEQRVTATWLYVHQLLTSLKLQYIKFNITLFTGWHGRLSPWGNIVDPGGANYKLKCVFSLRASVFFNENKILMSSTISLWKSWIPLLVTHFTMKKFYTFKWKVGLNMIRQMQK